MNLHATHPFHDQLQNNKNYCKYIKSMEISQAKHYQWKSNQHEHLCKPIKPMKLMKTAKAKMTYSRPIKAMRVNENQ